jgi:hypothetical protein
MFYTNTRSPVKTGRARWEYAEIVKQIATLRMTQAATKLGDQAPMAAVCCNACRTCVTTNIVGIAMAAVAGSAVAVKRLFRR